MDILLAIYVYGGIIPANEGNRENGIVELLMFFLAEIVTFNSVLV